MWQKRDLKNPTSEMIKIDWSNETCLVMFGEPIRNTGSPKELLLWDSRYVIRQTIGRDTKNNGCVVSLKCTNGIRSAKFELQCFCGAIGCHDQLYYVCVYIYVLLYLHKISIYCK